MHFLRTLIGSALLLTLVQCGTRSTEDEDTGDSNRACDASCEDRCDAFVGCGIGVTASCADECKSSLKHADCRGYRPADQYTCDELQEVRNCARYCTEFCVWAAACGTFDQQVCLEGCTYEGPPICNSASVSARTCDELKPEARTYDDVGHLLQEGGDFAFGGSASLSTYGLCLTARDCEATEMCALETNTCVPLN